MNICLVSREYPPETGWGGIGTYTYNLAHALTELGHEVHVIAQAAGATRDYADGIVHVHRIKPMKISVPFIGGALRNLVYSFQVYKEIKSLDYEFDIVETPNWTSESFCCSIFLSNKIPIVVRIHTPYFEVFEMYNRQMKINDKLICKAEEFSVKKAECVTSSTLGNIKLISQNYNLHSQKIKIVPLGINTHAADRSRLDGHTVLFIGRLEKRKGIETLIKAIPNVLKQIPDAEFIIIGRDTNTAEAGRSYLKYLKQFIKPSFVDKIKFMGNVPDEELPNYYKSCSVFVAPSLYESFGLIYIEGMAWGIPVIGCVVGGVPEVVENGKTGLLVPPEDPKALAAAMIKLLKDEFLRKKIGEAARECVERKFSREMMARNTLKIYEQVINEWKNKKNRMH